MMDDVLTRLMDEIHRIAERFQGNEDALDALQAVQNWVMDEMM